MPGSPGKKEKGEEVTPAFWFLIIPAVFFLDRVSKLWVLNTLAEGESLPLNFFFHLTRVNNTGAAFGLFRNLRFFLIATSIICIVALTAVLWRRSAHKRSALADTASLLIVSGALGNLYDRLRYGYVVDFLDFRVWPVFNVADSAITIGVGLALLHIFKKQTA